jgi:acyl dehydratase
MATFNTISDLVACVGQEVAVSEWTQITQSQVNQFAEATGDFQWIHVDVERAKAGPFGAPIAHGFLTLSLIPKFFDACIEVKEPSMGVNYGLNKVRFMSPVPVGSRVRGRLKLAACEPVGGPGGIAGVQMTWLVTVELEGASKPACVAESLGRRYPQVS